jgi:hypothetical protein
MTRSRLAPILITWTAVIIGSLAAWAFAISFIGTLLTR